MLRKIKYKRYFISALLTSYLLSLSQSVYAFNQDPTLGQAAQNMLQPVGIMAEGVQKLCYIIGGTLILGAGIQYKNYRDNPSAVRLSTPVVLLLLGIGLILVPIISNLSPASPVG